MENIAHIRSVKSIRIVDKAISGDKQAFEELINEHKIVLYKMGKSILRDDNDIADAMQETVYSAYKGIADLKNTEMFKPWLLRIMVNKCNDILRKQDKVIPVEEVEEVIMVDEYKVHNNHIYEAVQTLEDDLKILVMLYYYEDMAIEDIANRLKIPKGTIKSRLSRARAKLYESLKEDCDYGRKING